ncbi:MAG TPA: hypothetical protein PLI77_02110 [Bacteroidales bacterium]|nr:hypothetical protein [Bacteroidales bacterium]
MKKYICFLVFSMSLSAFSQNLNLTLYSTGTGKNVTLSYSKEYKSMEFGIGLGCNINSIKQPDDQPNIYYKRLYATKPLHFLNFNLYYNQHIFNRFDQFKPYIFYDFQMKYSTTRSNMYIIDRIDSTIISSDPADQYLYRNYTEYFGPFLWIENNLGLGMKINITEKLFISQKIGLGIHFIIGEEPKLFMNKDSMFWEFHDFYAFTVGFKF